MKRTKAALLTVLFLSMEAWGCGNHAKQTPASTHEDGLKEASGSAVNASPLALSASTSGRLRELLLLANHLPSQVGTPIDSTELEEKLQEHRSSIHVQLFLVQLQIENGSYSKGINELAQLLGHQPDAAEVHAAIGSAYCDLAILDMVSHNRYEQNANGFFSFLPDAQVQPVLLAAKAEFDLASRLGDASAAERAQNMQMYLEGHRRVAVMVAVMEDQATADLWLMASANGSKRILDRVRVNLDLLRWEVVLQTPPLMSDSLVSQLRKQNWEKIDHLHNIRDVLALKTVYDLGYGIHVWAMLWPSYLNLKKAGGAYDPGQYAEMIKHVGGRIQQYTNLLSIELTEAERKCLQLKCDAFDDYVSLEPNIENQLPSRYGHSYARLYAMAFSLDNALTILRDPKYSSLQQVADEAVSALNRLADGLNVPHASEMPGADLTTKISNLSDRLTDAILADVAKGQ